MKRYDRILLIGLMFLSLGITCSSCQKAYLETKPDKALLIPTTVADLWALADNNSVFNQTPGLTGIADDDFYTTDAGRNAFGLEQERNSYIWAPDIYGAETGYDWNAAYKGIFYANVILEGIAGATTGDQADLAVLKGTALFHRGFSYYGLAQSYAPVYQQNTLNSSLGVPLKLSADVTEGVQRSTLGETYQRIITDLKTSVALLPARTSYRTRPSKATAYGMLARLYLTMSDHSAAKLYADSALQLSPELIDYNTLSTTAVRPFPAALPNNNVEMSFYSVAGNYSFYGSSAAVYCDSTLYRSYAANDLRRLIFFRDIGGGRATFKGSYTGVIPRFAGIANDEIYLIRAECQARSGDLVPALSDLNTLLVKRWRTGTYVPMTASTTEQALRLILIERRKELVGRNMRWADLRRLNLETDQAITVTHIAGGRSYRLEPGSERYVLPIPPDERMISGIQQNER